MSGVVKVLIGVVASVTATQASHAGPHVKIEPYSAQVNRAGIDYAVEITSDGSSSVVNRLAALKATMQQSDNADESKSAKGSSRLRSNVHAQEGNGADLVTADYGYDNYDDVLGAEESGLYDDYDYSLGAEEKDTYDYSDYGLGTEEKDTYDYYDYGLGSGSDPFEVDGPNEYSGGPCVTKGCKNKKFKEDNLERNKAGTGIQNAQKGGKKDGKKPSGKKPSGNKPSPSPKGGKRRKRASKNKKGGL